MKILIQNIYQQMIEGSSVSITRAMSDPVPTCTIRLRDNTASFTPVAMSEVFVFDDQAIPNPTSNLFFNPNMNPFNSNWLASSATGLTVAQNGGGGTLVTCSNIAVGTYAMAEQQTVPVQAGITYCFSGYIQGGSTPTNIGVNLKLAWFNTSGNFQTDTQTGTVPVSTSLVRYSFSDVAPAGAVSVTPIFELHVTNSTNSGTITITQAQFEPQWFPAISYPTPWCGPNQPNCIELSYIAKWLRQSRKFAGFLTHATALDYHGNVRTWEISCVGYAWLMSVIGNINASFTNQLDSAIISSLLSTYVTWDLFNDPLVGTSNVISGVTLSNFGSNWDDLRTLFDNLAAQSGFYWTIDSYWNMIYCPPGYITQTTSLICDNSSTPDLVTTFPAYNFQAEMDYTQPGSSVMVIGSGSNVALVVDASRVGNVGALTGYQFPPLTTFARKVNDSTLQSVTDCTNRGMAELIQYDNPRNIYHLTTNTELVPGQGIAVTSNTDNLNKTVLLIQSVTATWIGTNETLTDVWEYQADLGATNRHVTNILSRLFRIANKNTSAPAISTTTLAVVESVGINDTIDGGSLYAQTIAGDNPIGYFRLGEPAGFSITTAYDWSGNTFNGTYTGGFTLGQTGAIYNDTNTATLFDGSTAWITLPSNLNGNTRGSLTVELWFHLSTASLGSFTDLIQGDGSPKGYVMYWSGTSSLNFNVGNGTTGVIASYAVAASSVVGQWVHIVGTYDGSNVRLYVNGVLRSTAAQTGSISATASPVIAGSTGHSALYPGTLDEVAIYGYALSQTQITTHYNIGTLGHA